MVPVIVACWLRSSSPSEMCLTAASVCRLLLLLDFPEKLQEEPALDSGPGPPSPAKEGQEGGGEGGASWSSPFNRLQERGRVRVRDGLPHDALGSSQRRAAE